MIAKIYTSLPYDDFVSKTDFKTKSLLNIIFLQITFLKYENENIMGIFIIYVKYFLTHDEAQKCKEFLREKINLTIAHMFLLWGIKCFNCSKINKHIVKIIIFNSIIRQK